MRPMRAFRTRVIGIAVLCFLVVNLHSAAAAAPFHQVSLQLLPGDAMAHHQPLEVKSLNR